eukprot:4824246-Prymnesium_polylepis.1
MEIYVDDSKLTLHGLQQHYVKLAENEKNRKLNELLDALEFNQASPSLIWHSPPSCGMPLPHMACPSNSNEASACARRTAPHTGACTHLRERTPLQHTPARTRRRRVHNQRVRTGA